MSCSIISVCVFFFFAFGDKNHPRTISHFAHEAGRDLDDAIFNFCPKFYCLQGHLHTNYTIFLLPLIQPVQFSQPPLEQVAQVVFVHAPGPVAADFAREIHARFSTQAEKILQGRQRKDRH